MTSHPMGVPEASAVAPLGTLTIRAFETLEEFRACVDLQKLIWGSTYSEIIPSTLMMLVQRLGGIASGAFDEQGTLAGFVFGITGELDGPRLHWSDTLAVDPALRDRGLGARLKLYQREELLARGIELMYWTFDPLESKNAYFNIARLGGTASTYYVDFYGETGSRLHQGLGTDRLLVEWRLSSARVIRHLEGRVRKRPSVQPPPLVNATSASEHGLRCRSLDLSLSEPRLRIAIPADIQAITSASLDLAREWRLKTRQAFQHYLGRGYHVSQVVREGHRTSYVLSRRSRKKKAALTIRTRGSKSTD